MNAVDQVRQHNITTKTNGYHCMDRNMVLLILGSMRQDVGVEDFSPEFVSHLDIPEMAVRMAKGQVPEIDREWAPSEVVGAMGTPNKNAAWWDRTYRSFWSPDHTYRWNSLSGEAPPGLSTEYFNVPIDWFRVESEHNFDDATRTQRENLGYL